MVTDEYQRLLSEETLILEATELVCTLLESSGVSKADLADRLGAAGIAELLTVGRKARIDYVSRVLRGDANMTLRTLADMAFVLGYRITMEAVKQ